MRHDWTIRAAVIGWLRYERQCPLVCYERSPFGQEHFYRPDICGVMKSRHVVEVEVKRSMSDFRANAKKWGLQMGYATRPRQFYFAVPPELVEKVKPELPEGAGLLTLSTIRSSFGPKIWCVRGAAIHKQSPRLTAKEMVVMAKHQTGSLHRAAVAISRMAGKVGAA